MRVSLDWLKELVDFDWSAEELADRLTMAGLNAWVVPCELPSIEVEITSNRPDWLSVIGIGREVSALARSRLRLPEVPDLELKDGDFELEVEEDCALRYFGLRIDGVEVGPSPDWLQKRLLCCGINPVNNVVDITNYVMLLFGQPLHAFDFDRINGGLLRVRRARKGEKIETIDHKERILSPEDIVIADAVSPVALAGIIGGLSSEITPPLSGQGRGTTRILLESALFPRVPIRRTRQRLGISTEASYRFERGVDPVGVEKACYLAGDMIVRLCGGRIVGAKVYDRYDPSQKRIVSLPFSTVEELTGVKVPVKEQEEILSHLGFKVKRIGKTFDVAVPSFRFDVGIPEDLVEEVLRIYGYDKLPSDLPCIKANSLRGEFSPRERTLREIAQILQARGYFECISFSLISGKQAELLFPGERLLKVSNTISRDYTYLRPSALPGLLSSLRYNASRGVKEVKLYEISQVLSGDTLCKERLELALVSMARDMGSAYAQVRVVLQDLFKGKEKFVPKKDRRFASYAEVLVDGERVGDVGKVRKRVSQEFDLKDPVFFLRLDLEKVLKPLLGSQKRYRPLPNFPAVERDLSMWVDTSRISHQDLVEEMQRRGGEFLKEVRLIDVFRKEGRYSYAYRLRFWAEDRTLTDEEVNRFVGEIMEGLKALGVELRI